MNFKEYYASVKDLQEYLKQQCDVAYSIVTGRKYLKLIAISFSLICAWSLFEGYKSNRGICLFVHLSRISIVYANFQKWKSNSLLVLRA